MKTWEEHKKECSEIYDKKWKEMETFRSQCENIVKEWSNDKLADEKRKWEMGGFIGGKEELLNRWIGEQSKYEKHAYDEYSAKKREENFEKAMENHREWAEEEAEQTFKYKIIVAELERRQSA
jgi:hypothetical protein